MEDPITVHIKSPFWSAYKRYEWPEKVEGYGINSKLIRQAINEDRKVCVEYNGVTYMTTVKAIRLFYQKAEIKPIFKVMRTDPPTTLIVLPRTIFAKV